MVGCAKAAFHPTTLICREMGIPFPKPFILEMDNEAARIFAEGTCKKSKMKHIDCAQEWVLILRDRDILIPVQ